MSRGFIWSEKHFDQTILQQDTFHGGEVIFFLVTMTAYDTCYDSQL